MNLPNKYIQLMKHLKLFENFQNIDSICKKFGIISYTINVDGTVDVDGSVYLSDGGLIKLPLKFGKVTGSFDCGYNQLTTLEGSPREVGGDFYCSYNQLTTLEGGPKEVGGNFYCHNNKLTTLEGGPREVGGYFNCSYNQLTTLEGGPREVGRGFDCSYNQLTTLEGGPNGVGDWFDCQNNQLTTLEGGPREVGGDFYCNNNPIYSVYQLFVYASKGFPDYKSFMDSLDYGYLRGTNIVKVRFQEALDELNIKMPESIMGYKYI